MRKSRTAGFYAVSTLALLALSGTVCLNAQVGKLKATEKKYEKEAAPVPPNNPEYRGHENTSNLVILQRAEDTVRKATEAYLKGEYKRSIDLYLEANADFEKIRPRSSDIETKIQHCKHAISRCYYYWAERVYYEALDSAELKQFDDAIQKCEQAAAIWPASKKKMQETIEKFKKMKDSAAYVENTKEETLLPDKKERLYSNDILMRQGDAYFADGQWANARAKYEEVLSSDPYNTAAIEAIRNANRKLIAAGKRRRNVVRQQFASEAIWTPVIPLIPRESLSEGDLLKEEGESAIVKEQRAKTINEKLDSIIIPSLDFEQELVSEVLKKIQQRSQELTNGDGINIVYLPYVGGQQSAAASNNNQGGLGGGENAPAANVSEASDDEKMITILTQNVPLRDAIQSICNGANLRYKIEDHAVLIAPKNVNLDENVTRIFPVEKTAYDDMAAKGDLKTYFTDALRINFEGNSGVKYISGRLVVTHTPENIKRIQDHIDSINTPEPQVLVEAKFMEVSMNDIEELGFQYSISRQNSNFKYSDRGSLSKYPIGYVPPTNGEESKEAKEWTNSDGKAQNIYSFDKASGKYIYGGTVQAGETVALAEGTEFYKKDAPLRKGSSQMIFGPNSANLVRNVNDIGSRTVMDGLFSAQYTDYKTGLSVSGAVRAIDQADSSDVMFCPRITTTNNFPAVIKMVTIKYFPTDWEEAEVGTIASGGRDVPLFTSSIPELEETEIGVTLNIQPIIGENNRTITVPMSPSVKEFVGWVDYSYPITVSVDENTVETFTNIIRMPIFENRFVKTIASCDDGETIILGGVVHDDSNSVDDRYPILGDLPLIGRLFQSKAKISTKKNLLIFMTCRLINPDGTPVREREMRGLPPFRQ